MSSLLEKIRGKSLAFAEVIAEIEAQYTHQPTAFNNGNARNEASQNQGSAKVFYFAQLNTFSKQDTLLLFAEHYQSVLDTPHESDHQNIRQFMIHGWEGIQFDGIALIAK